MHRLIAVLVLSAPAVFASDFGRAGQIAPSGVMSYSRSYGPYPGTDLYIAPGLSVFIVNHLALGFSLSYELVRAENQDPKSYTSFLPYLAVDVPISQFFSVFPSAGVFFSSEHGDRQAWGISAFLPLLVHPVNHFFFGLGPAFAAEMYSTPAPCCSVLNGPGVIADGQRIATISVRTAIGGYF